MIHAACKQEKNTIESHVARKNALQFIQFLLQYCFSRSSKVDDFHLIWKSLCHFLLVIYSSPTLVFISHRFQERA